MIVYDLEIFGPPDKEKDQDPNSNWFFIAGFYDTKSKINHLFQIGFDLFQIDELKAYLEENKNRYFVGFNNMNFDDPLLHSVVKCDRRTLNLYRFKQIANDLINGEFSIFKSQVKKTIRKSIDLREVNNFTYGAKATSLKKLEANFRFKNVSDLPYHHTSIINSSAKVNAIRTYLKHDLLATYDLLTRSISLLKYRRDIAKLYKLPVVDILTASEVKLAKIVTVKVLAEEFKVPEELIWQGRTYRDKIIVKDIIAPIKFNMSIHNDLLNFYKGVVLHATEDSVIDKSTKKVIDLKSTISYTTKYKNGLICEYGSGGIHGIVNPGIYQEDDEYLLDDIDFSSYYPHLVYTLGIGPAHLPDPTVLGRQLIKWFNERQSKYPKKTHWTLNYALKIIMNLLYGQMGSEYSPLYDVQAQLAVCVNGMLRITKLIELCILYGAEVLYANTDGIVIKYKKELRDKLHGIVNKYADHIKIPIEFVGVKKLIARDVNNFLLVDQYGNCKEKGDFETYNTIIDHGAYHKDTSGMIIPEAVKQYFINNEPIEDTIYNANNIHDFFYNVRGTSDFVFLEQKIVNHKTTNRLIVKNKKYDLRLMRYYIAKEGSTLTKLWHSHSKSGLRTTSLEAANPVIISNKIRKEEIHDYLKNESIKIKYDNNNNIIHRFPSLDKEYYIQKAYELVNAVINS